MSSGISRDNFSEKPSFWDEEEGFIRIKTPNALSRGEQRRLMLARREAYQKLKQATLTRVVFEMFTHKDQYPQYSESIVSLLKDTPKRGSNEGNGETSYVERDEEHLMILIKEFIPD